MRIITQHSLGGPEVLEMSEVDEPTPGAGEVRVVARAIGLNPVEADVRESYPILGDPPFTLGWDVAGVVDAVGPGVSSLAVGDRVFGMLRFPEEAAAYAEKVVGPADQLIAVPENLDDQQAAALPLVGLTAYQALVQAAAVQPGQRVLVQAAGGGVGHIAVQLARHLGAEVVATVSPAKAEFVAGLGADELVDYTTTDLGTVALVDVALDPFGGEAALDVLRTVRADGHLVMLHGEVEDEITAAAEAAGVTITRVMVGPHREGLEMLAGLAERGELTPHVSGSFALADVVEAHRALGQSVQGKLVLVP